MPRAPKQPVIEEIISDEDFEENNEADELNEFTTLYNQINSANEVEEYLDKLFDNLPDNLTDAHRQLIQNSLFAFRKITNKLLIEEHNLIMKSRES